MLIGDRFAWERTVRCRLCTPMIPKEVRSYLLYEITYGNADGSSIRPGEKRAAYDLECDKRTISRYNAFAVDTGFLVQTYRGGRFRGTSVYATALPVPVCPGHPDVYGRPRSEPEPVIINTTSRCHPEVGVEGSPETDDLTVPAVVNMTPTIINTTSGNINTTPGCRPTMQLDHEDQKPPPPTHSKVTDQKPPPPTHSKVTDHGGGGENNLSDSGGIKDDPAPTTPPLISAVVMAVIQHVAETWKRNVKALARLASRVAAAIDGVGWLPERLQRHLAERPPDDMGDGVGVLRYRLNQLPACPDECGRACCAQRTPVEATCLTHRVTIPIGDTCVYCDATADDQRRRAEQAHAERRQTEAERKQNLAEAAEQLGPDVVHKIAGLAGGIEKGRVRGALLNALDRHGWNLEAVRAEAESRAS